MLNSQIESILFINNKPITARELARFCHTGRDEVEVVLESLKNKFNTDESGIHILEQDGKLQMVINPRNSELVSKLIKEEISGELTRPQLETLTVIAYRGPITKLALEQIRGVNCSLILRNLLIKDLIEVQEDKIINNNIYKVSIEFIKHLGITSIEELPDYEELSKTEKLEDLC